MLDCKVVGGGGSGGKGTERLSGRVDVCCCWLRCRLFKVVTEGLETVRVEFQGLDQSSVGGVGDGTCVDGVCRF